MSTLLTLLGGHYKVDLQEIIGQGMFGIVYWAADLLKCRPVAVKTCRVKSEKEMRIAMADIKAQSELTHENVLTSYSAAFHKKSFWLVMDYCEYGQLDEYLKEYHPLQQNLRIELMVDMHRGIHFLHNGKRPIIHRDIKPANMLVTWSDKAGRPVVKVADFGQAKVTEEATGRSILDLFEATTRKGGEGFMAPEIYAQKPYNAKVDVFSLGLVYLSILQFDPSKMMTPATDCHGRRVGPRIAEGEELKIAGRQEGDTEIVLRVKDLICLMTDKDPEKRLDTNDSLLKLEEIYSSVQDDLPRPPKQKEVKPVESIEEVLRQAILERSAPFTPHGTPAAAPALTAPSPAKAYAGAGPATGATGARPKTSPGGTSLDLSTLKHALDHPEQMDVYAKEMGYQFVVQGLAELLREQGSSRGSVPEGAQGLVARAREHRAHDTVPSPPSHLLIGNFSATNVAQSAEDEEDFARSVRQQFKEHDIVRVPDDEEKVKRVQEHFGGWTNKMRLCLGMPGIVKQVDKVVLVDSINGVRFWWNPDVLEKNPQYDQSGFCPGDYVLMSPDVGFVTAHQKRLNKWDDDMIQCLGFCGVVKRVLRDKTVEVEYGNMRWVFDPLCLALVAPAEVLLSSFYRASFANIDVRD